MDGRDLASTYVLRPLKTALSQISEFTVMEQVFWNGPEQTEKTKSVKDGALIQYTN